MSVKLLKKKNYLTMIRNAAKGSNHMFQNLYASVDGIEQDINSNGGKSCGLVVSSILYLQKMIKDLHATVESTEKDMLSSGWHEISDLKEGAIIVWERRPGQDEKMHSHIGFFLGDTFAMSNDSNGIGIPVIHHYTYGTNEDGAPKRKIERIYWHPDLDQD
jgi:hypothetical protein